VQTLWSNKSLEGLDIARGDSDCLIPKPDLRLAFRTQSEASVQILPPGIGLTRRRSRIFTAPAFSCLSLFFETLSRSLPLVNMCLRV